MDRRGLAGTSQGKTCQAWSMPSSISNYPMAEPREKESRNTRQDKEWREKNLHQRSLRAKDGATIFPGGFRGRFREEMAFVLI